MLRLLLALALLLPVALPAVPAQSSDATPQNDFMIHFDTSQSPPRYIPGTAVPFVIVPGGLVQFMLFGRGPAHSLTLDNLTGYSADVPAGTQDGFYERSATFRVPMTPGAYTFHDKSDPTARGTLIIRAKTSAVGVASAGNSAAIPTIGVGRGYDTRFYPARLVVAPGATVLFTNNQSQIIHTLSANGGAFDLDAVEPGTNRTFRAPSTPGEYPFHCKYHQASGMTGVLVVQAAASTTPMSPAKTSPGNGALGALLALAAGSAAAAGWRGRPR